MKLLDLRKLAIKKQHRIRFHLRTGMECVLDQRGVALVPGLDRIPDFNLEQDLESAATFVLEPLNAGEKNAPKPRTLAREEMAAMVNTGGGAGAHHDDHDDEPVADPGHKASPTPRG
jgi:hypothetical protein